MYLCIVGGVFVVYAFLYVDICLFVFCMHQLYGLFNNYSMHSFPKLRYHPLLIYIYTYYTHVGREQGSDRLHHREVQRQGTDEGHRQQTRSVYSVYMVYSMCSIVYGI